MSIRSAFPFVFCAVVGASVVLGACTIQTRPSDPNVSAPAPTVSNGNEDPTAPSNPATSPTVKGDAGEGGTGSTDLCTGTNSCTDNGCKAAGGHCKSFGNTCACQRSASRCKLSNTACGDNGCLAIGGKCEFVGDNLDCICIKPNPPPPSPPSGKFELVPGAGSVFLVYLNGEGNCAGFSTSFEEPGKFTITGDNTITLVSPGRERVGQIDPDGSFYVRDANHDYVGKIAPDGSGNASVVYTGPDACTFTYAITIQPQG